MHQVDVSACLHWYFKKRGGLAHAPHQAGAHAGGKKPQVLQKLGIKSHILRYVLVDHASGAFYVRYYLAAGETALNLIDFLYHAWRRRETGARHLPRGSPDDLLRPRLSQPCLCHHQPPGQLSKIKWLAHQAGGGPGHRGGRVSTSASGSSTSSPSCGCAPPRTWRSSTPGPMTPASTTAPPRKMHRTSGQTRWQAWSAIKAE